MANGFKLRRKKFYGTGLHWLHYWIRKAFSPCYSLKIKCLIGVTWQVAIYFNKKCVLPNSPIGELFRKLCCKFQQFEIDSVMTLTLECFVRTWVRWRPTLVLYQFKSVKPILA